MSNIMDAIEAYGTAKDDEFDPFAYPKNKSMKILIVGKNDHSTNRLLLALLIAKKLSITKDIERSKVIIITSDESLMNLSQKFVEIMIYEDDIEKKINRIKGEKIVIYYEITPDLNFENLITIDTNLEQENCFDYVAFAKDISIEKIYGYCNDKFKLLKFKTFKKNTSKIAKNQFGLIHKNGLSLIDIDFSILKLNFKTLDYIPDYSVKDSSMFDFGDKIMITGQKGSGKTINVLSILKHIMKSNRDISILIIAPTDTHCYRDFMDKETCKCKITFAYDNDEIMKFISDNKNCVVVLDGCMYGKLNRWIKDDSISELLDNILVTSIFTFQFPLMPIHMVNKFDYYIFTKGDISDARKRIYEKYAGFYNSFDEFNRSFDIITKNSRLSMGIINSKKLKISKRVFKFDACYDNLYSKLDTKLNNGSGEALSINKLQLVHIFGSYKGNPSILIKLNRLNTELLDNILSYANHDECCVFAPIIKHKKNLFDHLVKLNYDVLENYDDVLKTIWDNQHCKNNKEVTLVFFGCEDIRKNKLIEEILMYGRHVNVNFIYVTTQLRFSPMARSNFDYVFAEYTDIISEQKRIYDHYFGLFPTFNSFKNVFEAVTIEGNYFIHKCFGTAKDHLDRILYYNYDDNLLPKKLESFTIVKPKKGSQKQSNKELDDLIFNIKSQIKQLQLTLKYLEMQEN